MEAISDYSGLWFLLLIGTAFLAGYVDSIAGGGGMIQLPVLLLSGVPPVACLATNKIVSMVGTGVAVLRYHHHGKVIWKVTLVGVMPCLVASYLGGLSALNTPKWLLEWMIIACVPIALFFTLHKKQDGEGKPKENRSAKIIACVTPIGFYDGFLGPGTGTYLAIVMHRFLHFDYVNATAIAKPLNLATNIGAAVAFLVAGKVVWIFAIPMAFANALGAWVGSHYAIQGGAAFIRRSLVFVLVVMLLANIIKMTNWVGIEM